VIAAAGQFSPTVPEKVIVLLSDGRDEGSQAPLDYAVASLQGIQVEAISLTTSQTDLASLSALGSVTAADDAAGMALAFDRVASLLAAVVAPTAPSTSPATTAAPTTSAAPSTTTAMTVPNTSTEVSQSDTVATAIDVPDPSNMPVVVGAAAVFLALFLIVVLAWPEPRVSKARLGIEDKKSVSDFGRRTASIVETALERQGRRTEFATTLAVADIPMRPGEFVGLVGVIALVSGSVVLLVGGPIAAIAVALAIYLSARWYVSQRTERRRQAFAEQLPDVMQLVTTALRSGFGLSQALDAVAEEAEEPARSEFAQVLTETRLGRDLPSAMRALADRMKSDDLAWVVSAIDINRDIGGNLSEVLSSVGTTIRERQRMARQVATYTAEGRLSARVLTVLPFVMAFWQWRANPDTFSRLFEGGGLTALIIAAVLLIVGSFWVRRIVNSISA
jgi:tight adherence protein B